MDKNINNYDTCSYMEGCELSLYRDGLNSQLMFNKNFYALAGYRRCANIYFFTNNEDVGEIPMNLVDLYDIKSATDGEIEAYLSRCFNGVDAYRDYIAGFGGDMRFAVSNWIEEQTTYEDYINESLPFKSDYRWEKVVGYSQGDINYVIYDPSVFTDGFNPKEMFTRLYYDTPLYCELTVYEDGGGQNSYNLLQYSDNYYEYDKAKLIESSIKHGLSGAVIGWLEQTLPEHGGGIGYD